MGVVNILEGTAAGTAGGVTGVALPGGLVLEAAAPGPPPARGAPVALALRPDALALLPGDTAADATTLPGTVEQAIFKGQSLDLWVGTAAGRLLARLDRAALAAAPEPGAACALRYAPGRAILLTDEPADPAA